MRIRQGVLLVSFLFTFFVNAVSAQVAPRPLITQAVDESQLATLSGNTHPLARPQFDIGSAAPDTPMRRMLLVLKRSPEQEHALIKLLDDQQDKASPNYHKWLTPDEFGQQFGPAESDLRTVTSWLQSHGFQVNRITHGRSIIEFSGVESQVEEALHTQIHKYLVNGEEHWANAADPQIPAALTPVVAGLKALNNFPATRHSRLGGVVTREKSTGRITPAKPLFTLSGQCGIPNGCFGVGPYDFATIYDVLPAWTGTPATDGTGETIAIVGETDINPQDIADFRNFFGLPGYGQQGGPKLNIIHDGPAPGILSDGEETESDLDVEWSGAVAKGANVDFVAAETTETTLGIDLSALHIVDNNLAPVVSESYGACELFLGSGGNQFFNALWQQAAAQGISVLLSSGDGSSAGCDDFNAGGPATHGLAVSGYASTPYNIAVGGTDFNDLTNASTYWSTTNDETTHASALSYIPETTWNDTCTNSVFGALLGFSTNAETNCNNARLINSGFVNIVGGSGGRSSCISSDGQHPASCTGGYAKPSWQNAPGVPTDRVRDVPDVSLFAAAGSPSGAFYLICEADLVSGGTSCNPNDPSTQFFGIGGTSASSPAFAGVMALVNQQQQARQGNANFVLYKLAQHSAASFHDITTGTIEVPCQTGSPNCTTSHSGDQFGILSGYNTAAGYDLATGIGSVDVNQLLQNWSSASFTATTTTLQLNPTTNLTHGQAVTVSTAVAPTSGSGTPTGAISLLATVNGNNVGVDGFKLSGGSASGTTNLLPGGTYSVTAHYSGDPTFGSSDSTAVNVTVGKEASNTRLQLVTFDFNGNLVSNNASTAVYGSPYLLRVNVLNSQNAACQPNPLGESGCPTGNVTLTDNSAALDGGTFALNSLGYAEDQLVQFPGGSNVVNAQYVGDNSFVASSTSATYAITPAPTTIGAPTLGSGQVGANFSVSATVQARSTGAAPSGTITFFANGTPIPGTPNYSSNSGAANATPTLQANLTSSSSPFSSAGTYSITASYSGDGNYAGSTSSSASISVKYPPPNITTTPNPVNVSPNTQVTLTSIVDTSAKGPVPSSSIVYIDNSDGSPLTGTETYTPITDAVGNTALQVMFTFTPTVSMQAQAEFAGDSNYPAAQSSTNVFVTVSGTDFGLSANPPAGLTIATPGQSGSLFIIVSGQSGFNGTINFSPSSCSGLPAEAVCSFNPSSVTGANPPFTGTQLTITTTGPHQVAANDSPSRMTFAWTFATGLLFGGVFLIPRRRRHSLLASIVCALVLAGTSCGGGGGSGSSGHTDPGTPTGSYTVTVTGTSGSGANAVSHTTTFTLVVQ